MYHDSVFQTASFDYAAAHRLGLKLAGIGTSRNLAIAVEVWHGSSQVFLTLLPGTKPDNLDWMRRKRNLALRFLQSSLSMRLECEAKGVIFHQRFSLPEADFGAHGGAVPIAVPGAGVIGVATVSGLPDTEDDALVREALASL